MFGSLKKKLAGFAESVSKKFKKESEGSPKDEKPALKKPKEKTSKEKPVKEEKKLEKIKTKQDEEPKKELREKVGLFKKLTHKKIDEEGIDGVLWELELMLLENNVANEVIEKIKETLKKELLEGYVSRKNFREFIVNSLKKSVQDVLIEKDMDEFVKELKKSEKPVVFVFLGVNGVGKTTSLAKFAHWLKKNKFSCVVAGGDTFRAASIEQLERHCNKLGVKLIHHKYGADSAAVAFDAIQYAKSRAVDCVLIDTAGRSHTNINLMDELKKIIRVANPDYSIFVGDSMTGNDAVEQAKKFGEAGHINYSILSKADCDEKGGAILSVAYVTGKPILFLGTGESYDSLIPFSKKEILKKLGL
ncbi:MAG: signal recognition particle-docking protein FtsY [Candidatus Nanoarchaeia archaeon]|nr:signal recognition particle-docking protein FtsY [Candidatus Nanoarchaeia archaeon]